MTDATPNRPAQSQDSAGRVRSLIQDMAAAVGLDPHKFFEAVKTLCGCEAASDAHFMALLVTAQKYGLDPLQKQIVLVNNKGKVSVTVPIDGWIALCVRHPDYVAHEVTLSWAKGAPETPEAALKGGLLSATAHIWTKQRIKVGLGPATHTEFFGECYVPPRPRRDGGGVTNGPWQSHPIRMLRWKALIQCARETFGLYVPDAEEVGAREEADAPAPRQIAAERAAVALPAPMRAPQTIVIEARPEPEPVAAEPSTPDQGTAQAGSDWDAEESRRIDRKLAEGG